MNSALVWQSIKLFLAPHFMNAVPNHIVMFKMSFVIFVSFTEIGYFGSLLYKIIKEINKHEITFYT